MAQALKIPNLKKKVLAWSAVLFWCGVIFFFSSLPDYENRPVDFETLVGLARFFFRKSCHLGEYAILMVLTLRAVRQTWENFFRWHFLLSFIFVLLYSISDECHQTFIFGRVGSVRDVLIDSIGAFLGGILIFLNTSPLKNESKVQEQVS